jgi:mono/diheme cytochrome c family protein
VRRFRWQANIATIEDVGRVGSSPKAARGRGTPYGFALWIVAASSLAGALAISVLAGNGLVHGKAKARAGAGRLTLGANRTSPLDLELGGDLLGVGAHATRFITREQLLALPQVRYTVANDGNFRGAVEISGVALDELARQFAATPGGDLAIAICSDKYQANYPRAYVAAHHPVLALKINGQDPAGWPKAAEGSNVDMGPYLISSPDFQPSYKILSYSEVAQIPWGVVRLEFRDEATVFNAIEPRGSTANSPAVQEGYRIARQNCFRCHNAGESGGEKANRLWTVLATWAQASPEYFAGYIRDPKSKNPKSDMPGFPDYDDATVRALTDYFRAFNHAPDEGHTR